MNLSWYHTLYTKRKGSRSSLSMYNPGSKNLAKNRENLYDFKLGKDVLDSAANGLCVEANLLDCGLFDIQPSYNSSGFQGGKSFRCDALVTQTCCPSLLIVLTSTIHLAQVGEAPYIAQAHSIGDTGK